MNLTTQSGATLNQQSIHQMSAKEYFSSMVEVQLTKEGFSASYFSKPTISYRASSNLSVSTHLNEVYTINIQTPIPTGITRGIDAEILASMPLFLKGANCIKIPVKTERVVRRYVPKPLLRKVHDDQETAVELCLIFLSNLSDTYFRMNSIGFNPSDYEKQGWKNLSTSILRQQFTDSPGTYLNIINCLIEGSSKGSVIDCDYDYTKGVKSYSYRLSEAYSCKGIRSYSLKTEYAKQLQQQNYYNRIAEAMQNPICKNLIKFYPLVELPTRSKIEAEATRLIKQGYTTKKGKRLTRKGKKKRDYWKHPDKRSFVEESIEIFEYLTSDGLMIPTAGGDKSGGRVVDSFTLMPSWIRNLIRVNGQPIAEVDYSALHPNIAMNLYGGGKKFLTHQQVAQESGVSLKDVKKAHLSFFNKRTKDMESCKLHYYYENSEPEMLYNIKSEKQNSIYGYKVTSRRMFKVEVDVMCEVVRRLNTQGIYVGYVYDALFCDPDNADVVETVMNKVILEFGVKTVAKS